MNKHDPFESLFVRCQFYSREYLIHQMQDDTLLEVASHITSNCTKTKTEHDFLVSQLLVLCGRDKDCYKNNFTRMSRICDTITDDIFVFMRKYEKLVKWLKRTMNETDAEQRAPLQIAKSWNIDTKSAHRLIKLGRIAIQINNEVILETRERNPTSFYVLMTLTYPPSLQILMEFRFYQNVYILFVVDEEYNKFTFKVQMQSDDTYTTFVLDGITDLKMILNALVQRNFVCEYGQRQGEQPNFVTVEVDEDQDLPMYILD
jgi:hypothetical protein